MEKIKMLRYRNLFISVVSGYFMLSNILDLKTFDNNLASELLYQHIMKSKSNLNHNITESFPSITNCVSTFTIGIKINVIRK